MAMATVRAAVTSTGPALTERTAVVRVTSVQPERPLPEDPCISDLSLLPHGESMRQRDEIGRHGGG